MTPQIAIGLLLVIAVIAANLPWLSERIFFFRIASNGKSPWIRLLEWLCLYGIVGAIAVGLETKIMGNRQSQGWEFYAVTFCLFLVFALPGFIYRHDLKHHLDLAKRRSRQEYL